jgi:hypothetical protein
MPTASWFVTALEARNNIRKDIAVHSEICAIEHEILQAVLLGDYEVTVNMSSMTQPADPAAEVFEVDVITNTLHVPDHGYVSGDLVTVSSTGLLPPPLVSGCAYYVIVVDDNHIRLASTRSNALAGRALAIDITQGVVDVILTSAGSGYITRPAVMVQGPSTTSAQLQAQMETHGSVYSVSVLTPGSGFTDAPDIQVMSLGSGAQAGVITFKAVSTQVVSSGSGYNVGDLLYVFGGSGTQTVLRVTQTSGGGVTGVLIDQPGNYTVLPDLENAVTLSDSGLGCVVSLSMGISSIAVLVPGTGYVNPPQIQVQGGGGTHAQVSATVNGGTVSQFVVTNPGSGYTSAPTLEITTGSGALVAAQLMPTGVSSISVVDAGSTFTDAPTVVLNSRGGNSQLGTVTLKVVRAVLINAGQGYSQGDQLLVSGGTYTMACEIQVLTTNNVGQILTFNITNPGVYTDLPILDTNNVLGGSGVGASFDLHMGLHGVEVLNGGTGYAAPPVVSITGTGTGAQAESRLTADAVSSVVITAPGTGYRSIPQITLDNGTGAQAVATLLPTSVDQIIILDGGSGYPAAPAVLLVGGGGVGATAEAVIEFGVVTQIIVTNPGMDYTSAPAVMIDGNAVGQALLVPTGVDQITVTSSGSNYTAVPFVAFSQGDALATAHLMPTGIASIYVQAPGDTYVSNPQLTFVGTTAQLGVFEAPVTNVNRSFAVADVQVLNTGSGYIDVPQILFGSPPPGGTIAQATAVLGSGSGVFTIRSYANSQDYFLVWRGITPSSEQLVRVYKDRMQAVIKYFTDLGYTITQETNPLTQNTFQWRVLW